MADQRAAYIDLISVYDQNTIGFILAIDAENVSYMCNPSKGTRSGFMQDIAKRDRLVSQAAIVNKEDL